MEDFFSDPVNIDLNKDKQSKIFLSQRHLKVKKKLHKFYI